MEEVTRAARLVLSAGRSRVADTFTFDSRYGLLAVRARIDNAERCASVRSPAAKRPIRAAR